MRHSHFTVFDDMISSNIPVYTSTEFNSRLGQYDQFAIGVVIDNVSATTNFDLFVEHSPDGRNWLARNDTSQSINPTGGTGHISITGLATGTTYLRSFADPCITAIGKPTAVSDGSPLLTFVRFRLQLSVNGASAHVKVHVAQRG